MNRMIVIVAALLLLSSTAHAQRFYPDDPIAKDPPPVATHGVNFRALSELYDQATNVFGRTGERQPAEGIIPAQGVNTMGDVPDGQWFVNRHARKRLSPAELRAGNTSGVKPSLVEPLRVLAVKKYSVRPGLLVADLNNRVYLLHFDPPGHMEMSTGAGLVGSRLFHALGYWVAESQLIHLKRSDLAASPDGQDFNAMGKAKKLLEEDIDLFLQRAPRNSDGSYRVLTLAAPLKAEMVGPFQFFGYRIDDPNDVVAHEHRRDLRALHVFSAWVNNAWLGPLQTMDGLVVENGVPFIRHYLGNFTQTLGSGFERAKEAREGFEPYFSFKTALENFKRLGITAPKWGAAHYPNIKAVGRFESALFDPETWVPNYSTAAPANHLPDDDYWAAKQILAFTDEDLKTLVETGEYSDPKAVEWITKCLSERRDKILKWAFNRVLAVDNFRIENGRLAFDDLSVQRGYAPARQYKIAWSAFNNFTRVHQLFNAQPDARAVPEVALAAKSGEYFAARISAGDDGMSTTVYLRTEGQGIKVVGVDRDWPGKKIAAQKQLADQGPNRYPELKPRQRELMDGLAAAYNAKTGFKLSPTDYFQSLSVSERTTFEAITQALDSTKLTDHEGKPLGSAIDLVVSIERIAGQYYGRQGDEQFRIYVNLRRDAKEVLEKCQEFHYGHENTVYHVGYPHSYRQNGKEPNIQFSMSEDGLKADIDVDYRPSKMPKSMWNGHLTAANSDIRAGDNYDLHVTRWEGLSNWWRTAFGELAGGGPSNDELLGRTSAPAEPVTPLPPDRPRGAKIEKIEDAAQELLTDWLVRRKYDEAMDFISDRALSCINREDAKGQYAGTHEQSRRGLRELLVAVSQRYGQYQNLTEAIKSVTPWRKAFKVLEHTFQGEFSVVRVPDAYAKVATCEVRSREAGLKALADSAEISGAYFGTMFRFRDPRKSEGVVAALFAREAGAWKIIAWQLISH